MAIRGGGVRRGVKKGLEQASGFYRLLITSHRFSQRAGHRGAQSGRAPLSRVFALPSIATLNFKPIPSARSTGTRRAKQGQFSHGYYTGRRDKNHHISTMREKEARSGPPPSNGEQTAAL